MGELTGYIPADKIYKFIKAEINPYGNPFDGYAYDLGLKIMDYIKKLAEHEQLDEQGLLLRLPYKVGERLWVIVGVNHICEMEVHRIELLKPMFHGNIRYILENVSKRGCMYRYYNREEDLAVIFKTREQALAEMRKAEVQNGE